MIVCVSLTVIGVNAGPTFDLYADMPLPAYSVAYATGITPAQLLAPASYCAEVDDNATHILIRSTGGVCPDVILPIIPCVTTTSTTIPPSTTTTTTSSSSTTTTTTTCTPDRCYGLLYNWYAASDVRIAPDGWRVPSNTDWETLRLYIASQGWNYDGTTTPGTSADNKQGKALASDCGWAISATTGAVGNTDYPSMRNISGFSGLPGGVRGWTSGIFDEIGYSGHWWSSTEHLNSWFLDYGNIGIQLSNYDENYGLSIRCVRDVYEGWEEDLPVIDCDGNEYDVVMLGTQLWFTSNLKVTHYCTPGMFGVRICIPEVTDNTEWTLLETGALCAYDNDWDNVCGGEPCIPSSTTTSSSTQPPTTTTSTTYGIQACLKVGMSLESVCEATEGNMFFAPGCSLIPTCIIYDDEACTIPVTGYLYVVSCADGAIFNVNPITGEIGSDTGEVCPYVPPPPPEPTTTSTTTEELTTTTTTEMPV